MAGTEAHNALSPLGRKRIRSCAMTDTHTHRPDAGPDAIINIEPNDTLPACGQFSTGVHPWRSREAEQLWPLVESMVRDSRIVAVGECGIDRLRGDCMENQIKLFERHAALAEAIGKPVIVHCVRAWAELLAASRRIRPQQPWIVHGFRGGPELARQLLDAGMHISLGERFNEATARIIPADRLHAETDTSVLPIETIAARIACARRQTVI